MVFDVVKNEIENVRKVYPDKVVNEESMSILKEYCDVFDHTFDDQLIDEYTVSVDDDFKVHIIFITPVLDMHSSSPFVQVMRCAIVVNIEDHDDSLKFTFVYPSVFNKCTPQVK